MCPDWKSNLRPFGLQASTQSTEPHQIIMVIFVTMIKFKNSNIILICMSLITSKAQQLFMFISICIPSFVLQLRTSPIFLFEHVSSFYFNQFVRNLSYMLQIYFPQMLFYLQHNLWCFQSIWLFYLMWSKHSLFSFNGFCFQRHI